MNRFIVCGRYDNGMLRVLDTSDWMVEPITVEQLKVIQSTGYSVVFNKKWDFIYSLFSDSILQEEAIENMKELTGLYIPYGDFNYRGDYTQTIDGNVEVYCFFSANDSIFITIRRVKDSYKMVYKRYEYNIFDEDYSKIRYLHVTVTGNSVFSVQYNTLDGTSILDFDFDCNRR